MLIATLFKFQNFIVFQLKILNKIQNQVNFIKLKLIDLRKFK